MTRYYYRPWKDETLVAALHFLRCRIIRVNDEGVEHVDALLHQLGTDPASLPLPRKVPKAFKRGELQRHIVRYLADSPKTGAEIAVSVSQVSGIKYSVAYKKVCVALNRLKKRGWVSNKRGLWNLELEQNSAAGVRP